MEHCLEETLLSYVRHDFLVGTHGKTYYQSSVCSYWEDIVMLQDVVVISFGAHVKGLISYPNGKKADIGAEPTLIIQSSANLVASKLRQLKFKNGSALIYFTAGGGIEKYTRDCSEAPASKPLPYDTLHEWQWIPHVQKSYVNEIRDVMAERKQPFLVLNLQHLTQMQRGCRRNYIHPNTTDKRSPYYLAWLILYNLLLEYRIVIGLC